jgi:hypothetical protein
MSLNHIIPNQLLNPPKVQYNGTTLPLELYFNPTKIPLK